ncbi:LacI family DNA-binding transcriptional regulator [Paenibacillus harenae]|uniref:LacI family DNA-binding transcriptional regulator n=1 Tax=Paenibacillus harenae TaxID=306543 RepID=UPI000423B8E9|nr:LacI family DNA-binding transcriptional regulator [Paenibacillus harenae]
MKGKVTIQAIADYTGLSKFAVSRGLSGKSGVSPQTRESILKAAAQLGYFKELPHASESTELNDLNTRNWSGTVLVLFPNIRYQNTESLYWGPIINGISTRLDQKGINILTLTEPKDDSVFSLLNPEAIMGIITVGSISTSILLEIKRLGIPVMMVDHYDPAFKSDSIFADNISSIREITTAAIRKGYRNFQFVGNIKDAPSFYERYMSFRATLEDHDIELKQIPELIGPEIDSFHEKFPIAIRQHGLPEAFICINDIQVASCFFQFDQMKIPLSERPVCSGFDNTHPDLPIWATVNIDKELLGKRAVDQLLWRILNPKTSYEKILIQAEVIFKD